VDWNKTSASRFLQNAHLSKKNRAQGAILEIFCVCKNIAEVTIGYGFYIGRVLINAQAHYVCHYAVWNIAVNDVMWEIPIIMACETHTDIQQPAWLPLHFGKLPRMQPGRCPLAHGWASSTPELCQPEVIPRVRP
jgi:hypothetical protein